MFRLLSAIRASSTRNGDEGAGVVTFCLELHLIVMAEQLSVTNLRSTGLGDDEIVVRVRRGEVALFELLMGRHNQRVYRAVRSIVRDESDAEDVMQQAYLAAFEKLDQFRGHAAFST